MSSIILSTQDILNHRSLRRASGVKGCKDGSDAPLTSLHGISWRPLDPMNPSCFCFDCRDEYDSDGTIDLQLYNEGHEGAKFTYDNLSEKEENHQYNQTEGDNQSFFYLLQRTTNILGIINQ